MGWLVLRVAIMNKDMYRKKDIYRNWNITPLLSYKGLGMGILLILTVFVFTGCGTQKSIDNKDASTTEKQGAQQQPATYHVEAHPDVISIAEGIDLFNNHGLATAIAKKYSYKKMDDYSIYRLENYNVLLYKNCRLPKKVGSASYEDAPLPLAKGTSSYVTVAQTVQIAVFNNKAYQNLIEQVKGLGFSLTEQGYEDKYSNGTIDIYTYAPKKLFRIEKAL